MGSLDRQSLDGPSLRQNEYVARLIPPIVPYSPTGSNSENTTVGGFVSASFGRYGAMNGIANAPKNPRRVITANSP